MKKTTFILAIIGTSSLCMAQPNMPPPSMADSLRTEGKIYEALDVYDSLYQKNPKDLLNTFNYAKAYAYIHQKDSAMVYIHKAIAIDPSTVVAVVRTSDFMELQNMPAYTSIEDSAVAFFNSHNMPIKNPRKAKTLWQMLAKDQAYMTEVQSIGKKLGEGNVWQLAIWNLKHKIDKPNQDELIAMVDKEGWPKISEVGAMAASGAFLIIQHSSTVLQKKYLPTIEKLCKEKEASGESYALMYDRVQVADGKPQRYGSQLGLNPQTGKYELSPLEDKSKVDAWRKDVGLSPLADYVKQWGVILK